MVELHCSLIVFTGTVMMVLPFSLCQFTQCKISMAVGRWRAWLSVEADFSIVVLVHFCCLLLQATSPFSVGEMKW